MQILAAAEALAISASGAWTEADLTGAPYSIPTTATFALLHVVLKKTTAPGASFQVRSAASAQGTYGAEESSQDATASVMSVLAPLSAGKFDYYTNATTAGGTIEVAVVGYFSALDGAAFNTSIDITPADPGLPSQHPLLEGWETINVGAYVPSTFNLAVCSYHDSEFGADKLTLPQDTMRHAFDLRETGGAAVISETADAYGGWASGQRSAQYFLAPLDALGRFDAYGYAPRQDASVARTILLHGYLKANLNASPASVDAYAFTNPSSSAWMTRTASVAARAVLVYFRNADAFQSVLGYRMFGETGAFTTAMESGESQRGVQQGVVPLDGSSKWEEWEEFGGTFSGVRSYTIAYFITEELLEETATVADTLVQDLYTRELEESAAVTDTLAVGDITSDTISESSAASDAIISDHARGAVSTESVAAADSTVAALERASASGEIPIDFIVMSGSGLTGFAATNALVVPPVSVVADGLFGDIATGTLYSSVILGESSGLWGGVSDSPSLAMYIDLDGDGAHGNIGSGIQALVVSTGYVAANATGFVSSGGSLYASIVITGSAIGPGMSGSGTLYIPVSIYSDIVNSTGLANGEVTWLVFPFNVPLAAASRYDQQYAAYAVSSGKSYAIVNGVIRRIGERTDNGTAISSIIAKSGIDGGSGHRKIATDIFMRLMSEGNFTVNVASDRGNGQITITDNLARKHGSKGDLPKGVIGREFAFSVKNVDGAYFEIDEIELIMALSEGRRGRQTNG